MFKIILLGPPGAGKGTEGELLAKEFGLKRLSVGALLRRLIKEKTSIGKKVEKYVRRGLSVPPNLLSLLLSRWFSANKNGFIIDDFPTFHIMTVVNKHPDIFRRIFINNRGAIGNFTREQRTTIAGMYPDIFHV